jgi:hypothetical protein
MAVVERPAEVGLSGSFVERKSVFARGLKRQGRQILMVARLAALHGVPLLLTALDDSHAANGRIANSIG